MVKLTRNKNLYKANKQDTFYDRMIILFFHLSFLLKVYKNNVSKKELQNFFDYFVRQIELSIREIGYGDATINKKMKEYVNLLFSIIENNKLTYSFIFLLIVASPYPISLIDNSICLTQ